MSPAFYNTESEYCIRHAETDGITALSDKGLILHLNRAAIYIGSRRDNTMDLLKDDRSRPRAKKDRRTKFCPCLVQFTEPSKNLIKNNEH